MKKVITFLIAGIILLFPVQRLILFEYGAKFNPSYILFLILFLCMFFYVLYIPDFKLNSFSLNVIIFLLLIYFVSFITFVKNNGAFSELWRSLLPLTVFCLPFILIPYIEINKKDINKIFTFLSVFVISTSIIEITIYILSLPVPKMFGKEFLGSSVNYVQKLMRVYGTFHEPAYVARTTVFLFFYWLSGKLGKKEVFISILLVLVLIGTASLSGVVFLAMTIILLLWSKNRKKMIFQTALFLIVFWILLTMFSDYFTRYTQRIDQVVYLFNNIHDISALASQRSTFFRIYSNFVFLELDSSEMLFGIGYSNVDNFALYSSLGAENFASIISWIIITTGFAGLMIYMGFFYTVYRCLSGRYRYMFILHMLSVAGSGSMLKPIFWVIIYLLVLASQAETSKNIMRPELAIT